MYKILVIILLMNSFVFSEQFIHTEGNKILDEKGNQIIFNGINLGNWLIWEGYLMMGNFEYKTHTQFFNDLVHVVGNDTNKAKEFEYQWRLNYVTQKTIDDIKQLGFNSVRVPFHYKLFWNNGRYIDDGFEFLDSLIKYCKKDSIYILLDMHAAPGYQNPGDHSDNLESNESQPRESVHFWDGDNITVAAKVWKYIANRYKNETIIWGYDLLNEPVPQDGREWELLPSLKQITDSIRKVDTNHIIVAEGSWWASDLTKLDWTDPELIRLTGINKKWDNKLVYETHHYSTDVSLLNPRLELCNKLNIPLILGEYGENNLSSIREITDWCIKNNVSFFPWTFKKMYHDKTIWTIKPNSAYQAMIDAIASNNIISQTIFDEVLNFCKKGIVNGSVNITFDTLFYFAIAKHHPYLNVINKAPGIIEAENFDEPFAYFDLSEGNIGGEYRDTDVDITKGNGGFAIGWIEDKEWVKYTIFAEKNSFYDFNYVVATEKSGKIKLFVDNKLIDSIFIPYSGAWDEYDTISQKNIYLSKGKHVFKLLFYGEFNLDKLILSYSEKSNLLFTKRTNLQKVKMFPNPVKDILYINGLKDSGEIFIYNIFGHLCYKQSFQRGYAKLNLQNLKKGMYFLKIVEKGDSYSYRFYKD